MTRRMPLITGFGSLLFAASVVTADPILLASYDHHWDEGGASSNPIHIPWEVAFIIQLSPPGWEPWPQVRSLGEDVFWGEGDSGSVTFSSSSDEAFTDFASYATNGRIDDLTLWALDPSLGGTGLLRSEETVFQGSSDLYGYELESVVLTIESIHFEPWSPFPGENGYLYSADINWSFYGIPVPETTSWATVLLLWLTCPGAILRRRIES